MGAKMRAAQTRERAAAGYQRHYLFPDGGTCAGGRAVLGGGPCVLPAAGTAWKDGEGRLWCDMHLSWLLRQATNAGTP